MRAPCLVNFETVAVCVVIRISRAWLPARLDMTPKNPSWPATCTHYSTTVLVAGYDKNRDYKGSMMTRQPVEASLSLANVGYDVIRVATLP